MLILSLFLCFGLGFGEISFAFDGTYLSKQNVTDLLLLYFALPVEALQRALPESLVPATWNGTAWLAVTPYQIRDVQVHFSPLKITYWAVDLLTIARPAACSDNVALNGYYTFSSDADLSALLGWIMDEAGQPVHLDKIAITRPGANSLSFQSVRTSNASVVFRGNYTVNRNNHVPLPKPGSLEEFVTNATVAYLISRGRVHAAFNKQPQWDLYQLSDLHVEANTIPQASSCPPFDYSRMRAWWTPGSEVYIGFPRSDLCPPP